jgi:hypothetical protein
MKSLALLIVAAIATTALPTQAVTNIGVSIGINAPGQYGRIDIGQFPQPVLVMPQPVIHVQAPYAGYQRAVYLYVPPAHRANWGQYCGRYGACGQPVYFVREDWVRDEYRRENDRRQSSKPGKGHGHKDKDHDRGRSGGNGKRGD